MGATSMEQQTLLYDERFLENHAGAIITDPATAIVELVANCWDAYATEVRITWPDTKEEKQFKILDNGHGMTRDEFQNIWRTIDYNRLKNQGRTTEPPSDVKGFSRTVFGKNGKGRFASFCFASEYIITSKKNGQEFVCKVRTTSTAPLVLEELSFTAEGVKGHGTEIVGTGTIPRRMFSEEQARELIGSRFLANPSFKVSLNGSQITFNDIPELLSTEEVEVEGYGTVRILHIDSKKADKTTKQHGIAWWVQDRAVGECKWSGSDYERILDGRTSEAKRFTFIVKADYLNQQDAVFEDWKGFKDEHPAWIKTRETVQDRIRKIIFDSSKTERENRRSAVIDKVGNTINTLSPVGKERVQSFINEVVDTCPNFGENEIVQLSTILAKLEQSKSRYGLLDLLHKCEPHDYDNLHTILNEWTIGMAKLVLDEIQNRLKIINEFRIKIQIAGIDEVKELQPLFSKGLWMFGDKFESIHFTSNKGMTTVIRELFDGKDDKASLNRPDFVIRLDSSVGFFSLPTYSDEFQEEGVQHLVIVDLKTTKLSLGSKEKEQIWKYVKELRKKGYIQAETRIDGFVLGDQIEPGEGGTRTEDNDRVRIQPLLYSVLLSRAEQRLLKLFEKVKDAPFLLEQQEQLKKFIEPVEITQKDLLTKPSLA